MRINFTTASGVPSGAEAVAVPVGADLDVPRAVRSIPSAGPNGTWEDVAQAVERGNAGPSWPPPGFAVRSAKPSPFSPAAATS